MLEKLKKLEKKNTLLSDEQWNVLKETADLCLRLLKVNEIPPATAATQSMQTAEQIRSGHVMLSYNWSTKSLVQKLKAKLREGGLSTWMDEDNIGTGSVNQSMADAVEQSAAVLVCYSSGYRWSDNCRKEAEYAEVKKVHILFVRAEEKYAPDGWLGLMLGKNLYFDLTKDFDKKAAELMNRINEEISKSKKATVVPQKPKEKVQEKVPNAKGASSGPQTVKTLSNQLAAASLCSKESPPFLNWTVEEVQKWLKNNGLEFLLSSY